MKCQIKRHIDILYRLIVQSEYTTSAHPDYAMRFKYMYMHTSTHKILMSDEIIQVLIKHKPGRFNLGLRFKDGHFKYEHPMSIRKKIPLYTIYPIKICSTEEDLAQQSFLYDTLGLDMDDMYKISQIHKVHQEIMQQFKKGLV